MVNNRRINMVLKTIEFEYNETIKMRSPNPRRAMEDGDWFFRISAGMSVFSYFDLGSGIARYVYHHHCRLLLGGREPLEKG